MNIDKSNGFPIYSRDTEPRFGLGDGVPYLVEARQHHPMDVGDYDVEHWQGKEYLHDDGEPSRRFNIVRDLVLRHDMYVIDRQRKPWTVKDGELVPAGKTVTKNLRWFYGKGFRKNAEGKIKQPLSPGGLLEMCHKFVMPGCIPVMSGWIVFDCDETEDGRSFVEIPYDEAIERALDVPAKLGVDPCFIIPSGNSPKVHLWYRTEGFPEYEPGDSSHNPGSRKFKFDKVAGDIVYSHPHLILHSPDLLLVALQDYEDRRIDYKDLERFGRFAPEKDGGGGSVKVGGEIDFSVNVQGPPAKLETLQHAIDILKMRYEEEHFEYTAFFKVGCGLVRWGRRMGDLDTAYKLWMEVARHRERTRPDADPAETWDSILDHDRTFQGDGIGESTILWMASEWCRKRLESDPGALENPFLIKRHKDELAEIHGPVMDLKEGIVSAPFGSVMWEEGIGILGFDYRLNTRSASTVETTTDGGKTWRSFSKTEEADHLLRFREQLRYIDKEGEPAWLDVKQWSRESYRLFLSKYIHNHRVDSVLDYIAKLPEWDGTERLKHILTQMWDCGENDPALVEWASEYLLLAPVERTLKPGCVQKSSPVIMGETTIGKSFLLHELCIDMEWFKDGMDFTSNKQQRWEALQGAFLVEVPEMAGLRIDRTNEIKQWKSQERDQVRGAYAEYVQNAPRNFAVVGTCEPDNKLPNSKGLLMRFVNVLVKAYGDDDDRRIEWVRENLEQLWAEAVNKARAGRSADLPGHLRAAAMEVGERRAYKNPLDVEILEVAKSLPDTAHYTLESMSNLIASDPRKSEVRDAFIRLGFKHHIKRWCLKKHDGPCRTVGEDGKQRYVNDQSSLKIE